MDPIIEVNHLKYRYPNTSELALNDVSFSVKPGEFIGIIGASGAGKSTLTQALIGLVPQFYKGAYGGSVTVKGMNCAETPVSTLCRTVGHVFQNPFNQLSGEKDTVFDEIAFGLQNFGIPREEMIYRIEDAMELLEISEFRDRNPFDLSGGQMQRVAIASILVMQPDIMILDEPTSQLDPAGTEEVFRSVLRLVKSGKTILMVEQKMEKLASYCDRMLLLSHGSVVAFDTPEVVFSRDDLSAVGVQAPCFTHISKALAVKCPDGTYPATLEEMLPLKDQIAEKISSIQKKTEKIHPAEENDKNDPKELLYEVKQMGFSYDPGTPLLQNITTSFDARSTAIIGQNGAGKTTFVKLLKGLLRPVSGSIFYGKTDISTMTVAMLSREVGYIFQNPDDQIFKSKVIDEVMFGPLNIGMSKEEAREKSLAALAVTGLSDCADRNPYDLELSERKMVAIASVIAMDTKVVIFDEPTIAQDYTGRECIKSIIRRLSKEGKLVIAILHDMDFVAECFERVIVMAKGKILADSAPEDVFAQSDILEKARLELPHVTALCRSLGFSEEYLSVEQFLEQVGKDRERE